MTAGVHIRFVVMNMGTALLRGVMVHCVLVCFVDSEGWRVCGKRGTCVSLKIAMKISLYGRLS